MSIDQEKLNAGKVVVQAHNLKAPSVWNSAGGRYDQISHSIADAIEQGAFSTDGPAIHPTCGAQPVSQEGAK
jgi:hypothetical protein